MKEVYSQKYQACHVSLSIFWRKSWVIALSFLKVASRRDNGTARTLYKLLVLWLVAKLELLPPPPSRVNVPGTLTPGGGQNLQFCYQPEYGCRKCSNLLGLATWIIWYRQKYSFWRIIEKCAKSATELGVKPEYLGIFVDSVMDT